METKLKTDSIPLPLTYSAVAASFAICGALSAAFLLSGFPDHFCFWFPIPFALLCSLLFMRTLLLTPIMWVVWNISYLTAFVVGFSGWPPAPGCAGGLLGALGLMFCSAVCRKELFASKYFIRAAVIGTLGGIPFIRWVSFYLSKMTVDHANASKPPLLAFAIWQAAVGTYLYAISTSSRSEQEEGQSDENDVSVIRLNLPR